MTLSALHLNSFLVSLSGLALHSCRDTGRVILQSPGMQSLGNTDATSHPSMLWRDIGFTLARDTCIHTYLHTHVHMYPIACISCIYTYSTYFITHIAVHKTPSVPAAAQHDSKHKGVLQNIKSPQTASFSFVQRTLHNMECHWGQAALQDTLMHNEVKVWCCDTFGT